DDARWYPFQVGWDSTVRLATLHINNDDGLTGRAAGPDADGQYRGIAHQFGLVALFDSNGGGHGGLKKLLLRASQDRSRLRRQTRATGHLMRDRKSTRLNS